MKKVLEALFKRESETNFMRYYATCTDLDGRENILTIKAKDEVDAKKKLYKGYLLLSVSKLQTTVPYSPHRVKNIWNTTYGVHQASAQLRRSGVKET
jgi:hypothetical protein